MASSSAPDRGRHWQAGGRPRSGSTAMTKKNLVPGASPGGSATAPRIVPLWRERLRVEQLARFKGLRLQSCDDAGKAACAAANAVHQQLPNGVRIDLPSWRVFSRVLGLYRSGASLNSRPMTVLELSAAEIAGLVGYSRAA